MSRPGDLPPRGHKIALSGCFSSGKTTMFGILTDRFPRISGFVEIATAAKSVCPTLDWRRSDVRGYLRWAQIVAERGHERAGGVALFDGSYADLVAHERLFGAPDDAVPGDCEPLAYALTLLCDPVGVPVEINGIRETDEALRYQIHALVVEEVRRRSERVVELRGRLEERAATAIREVEAVLAGLEKY